MGATAGDPNASGDATGLIMGWLDGQMVHMSYTRTYVCAEAPVSAAPTNRVVGA